MAKVAARELAIVIRLAHDTLSKIPVITIPVPPSAITEVLYNKEYAYLPLEWLVEVNNTKERDPLKYTPPSDTDAPANATKNAYDELEGYFTAILSYVAPFTKGLLNLFLADRVIPPQPEATGSASDITQPKVIFASPDDKDKDSYGEWIKQGGKSESFRRWCEKNKFEYKVVGKAHRENTGTN